jgi:hypothetical protein
VAIMPMGRGFAFGNSNRGKLRAVEPMQHYGMATTIDN